MTVTVTIAGKGLDKLLSEIRNMAFHEHPIYKLSLSIENDYWYKYKINGQMWSPPYELEV